MIDSRKLRNIFKLLQLLNILSFSLSRYKKKSIGKTAPIVIKEETRLYRQS